MESPLCLRLRLQALPKPAFPFSGHRIPKTLQKSSRKVPHPFHQIRRRHRRNPLHHILRHPHLHYKQTGRVLVWWKSKVDHLVFEELVRGKFPRLSAVNHQDYLGVQMHGLLESGFLSIFLNMLPWESGQV
ncbi:hypothetical protein MRB53_020642 [Persea americana]|uniref:Uncharacterized protein n=1 Tax=Persea americana TaxID=3435 RepID=A0ACC2L268_PERAE|nr:hypothetical protein MRB53_020642 [Persea americana]